MAGKDKDVGIRFVSHPSEDVWENYAFGRLPEDQLARLEEHLLACPACQSLLASIDNMIHAMRSVSMSAIAVASASPAVERWIPFPVRPVMVGLMLATGLVMVGIGVSRRHQSELPVAFVTLASFRGAATASAPAGRPLDLEISRSDIPVAAAYSLEVVTQSGDSAWKGTAEAGGGKLVGHLPKGLGRGAYWVRLFGPRSELLREFGLQVE